MQDALQMSLLLEQGEKLELEGQLKEEKSEVAKLAKKLEGTERRATELDGQVKQLQRDLEASREEVRQEKRPRQESAEEAELRAQVDALRLKLATAEAQAQTWEKAATNAMAAGRVSTSAEASAAAGPSTPAKGGRGRGRGRGTRKVQAAPAASLPVAPQQERLSKIRGRLVDLTANK